MINTIISIIESRDGLGGFYALFQMCGYKNRMNNEGNNGEGATNSCPSPTLRIDDEFVIEDDDSPRYDAEQLADKLSHELAKLSRCLTNWRDHGTGAKVPFSFNWECLGFYVEFVSIQCPGDVPSFMVRLRKRE